MNEKLLLNFHFPTRKGYEKFGHKLNRGFPLLPHPLTCKLVNFFPVGQIFRPWQVFYFVTLKSHANFGIKLNAVFQISPQKIGQILCSGQKGYKFLILLLPFVRNVNCLNQKNLKRNFILSHWRAIRTLG